MFPWMFASNFLAIIWMKLPLCVIIMSGLLPNSCLLLYSTFVSFPPNHTPESSTELWNKITFKWRKWTKPPKCEITKLEEGDTNHCLKSKLYYIALYFRQLLAPRETFSEENWKKIYYLANGNGQEMRQLMPFMRWQCNTLRVYDFHLAILVLWYSICIFFSQERWIHGCWVHTAPCS